MSVWAEARLLMDSPCWKTDGASLLREVGGIGGRGFKCSQGQEQAGNGTGNI